MILSVDPGRDKTGCAVVEEDGSLVVKKVIPTKDYEKEIAKLLSSFTPRALIMGNARFFQCAVNDVNCTLNLTFLIGILNT